MSVRSRYLNWNLKVLVLEKRGNPRAWRKTSGSKGKNQQQTQPTYGVDARIELNPDHIGGRRAILPLCHPCSPEGDWVHIQGRALSEAANISGHKFEQV